ncbi:hypothetical protein YK48G_04510 [Lentilactobacillus fungorum]|uniref:Uncharacterized protein n=1 Tax=Lentilactobacillus fungorum TaxID=2201250 RepID=A0ABQ3VX77_9LACO|nr:hypothetical protein YK48G_04510 [Lentilactobacillus fungorum]
MATECVNGVIDSPSPPVPAIGPTPTGEIGPNADDAKSGNFLLKALCNALAPPQGIL